MVVLPRNSGTGFLPSSQMYSSLYFFIIYFMRSFRMVSGSTSTFQPWFNFNRRQESSRNCAERRRPACQFAAHKTAAATERSSAYRQSVACR